MEESKFTVWYDDQLNDVIDRVANALAIFGLMIKESSREIDGGQEYIITMVD